MAATKKLLAHFDPSRPTDYSGEFVIPWRKSGSCVLLGPKSHKEAALGMVVYVGREITENDLFAKLVESGVVIPSVDDALATLRSYVEQLSQFRIGTIIRLAEPSDQSVTRLELVAVTPSALKF